MEFQKGSVMSSTTINTTADEQLQKQNEALAPLAAQWIHAFLECSDEVQGVIRKMASIITSPDTDDDDKDLAIATLLEALFPVTHNGELGADLLDLEDDLREDAEGAKLLSEMDEEEATFAARVKEQLEKQNLTQEQLASRVGIGQPAVSMMLNRESRPQKRTVVRIAEALGVSPQELWPSID